MFFLPGVDCSARAESPQLSSISLSELSLRFLAVELGVGGALFYAIISFDSCNSCKVYDLNPMTNLFPLI